MNVHDSERLAGVLVAAGMQPSVDLESADVVVLNTCCIRENADNRFYGHLGNLKTLRERRPHLQIAVGGCLAQMEGERLLERAPHVDVVFGTHNLARAPELLARSARSGTGGRSGRCAATIRPMVGRAATGRVRCGPRPSLRRLGDHPDRL